MKTTLKIFPSLLIVIILISACSKNQSLNDKEIKVQSLDVKKIESTVKYCTDRIKNPLKTTDSIPVDSLSYYLAATANYTYGIASAQGELQKVDSNFFKVSYYNNKIAMTDVISVYNIIIDSVRASFYRINHRNKHLVMASVIPMGNQSNKIKIKVTSVILYGNNYQFGGFDTTDYWLYRGAEQCYGGKCGPYAGQGNICMDAALNIQNAVMLRKGVLPGCYVPPFTDVYVYPNSFPNPGFQGTNYNYFRYLFYYSSPSFGNDHDCLMPFEMNRYLNYAEYCVYTLNTQPSGARPDGSSFISIDLHGELMVGLGGVKVHKGWIHYGIYLQGGYQSDL